MAREETTPLNEIPALVRNAVQETQNLIKLEIALAREDIQSEIAAAKLSAIAFTITASAALLALAMGLVAIVLAAGGRPLAAIIVGLVMLCVAAVAGFSGYKALPKRPFLRTRERIESDAR